MRTLLCILLTAGVSAQALPAAPLKRNGLLHKTSFQETYNRYPSPFGIIQIMKMIVPFRNGEYPGTCEQMSEQSAPVTGVIDPLQGSALEEEPGALFYPYFEKCVRDMGSNGFYDNATALKNSNEILGEDYMGPYLQKLEKECQKTGYDKPFICNYQADSRIAAFWYGRQWKSLKEEERLELMPRFIRYLVGPAAVQRRLKLVGENNVFGADLKSPQDLAKFISDAMAAMKDGDSDLSVLQVYLETAILLRLGPALKN
jgi:hypothetical protein